MVTTTVKTLTTTKQSGKRKIRKPFMKTVKLIPLTDKDREIIAFNKEKHSSEILPLVGGHLTKMQVSAAKSWTNEKALLYHKLKDENDPIQGYTRGLIKLMKSKDILVTFIRMLFKKTKARI